MTYEDKINQLAQALDQVDQHVRGTDQRMRREQRNRLSMLHLHATAAILIGILFAMVDTATMSGPNWVILRQLPGMPVSLGVMMSLGGAILGPATHWRHLRWEKIGLWIILCWYAVIALSFGGAALLFLAGSNPSSTTPAFYASLVYFHLTCVMAVHLNTLSRISRLAKVSR